MLVLRTRGIYFIMVTLAFAQMLFFVFHDTKLGGGSDGIYIYVKPSMKLGDVELANLDKPAQFYWLALFLMAASYLLLHRVLGSSFGRALVGIKVNEHRMQCARLSGIPLQAGEFHAGRRAGRHRRLPGGRAVRLRQSGNPVLAPVRRGADDGDPGRHGHALRRGDRRLRLRAPAGSAFSNQAWFGAWAKHWQLAMGILIMLVALYLPQGLAGLAQSREFRYKPPEAAESDKPRTASGEPILRTQGLTKRFGGLVAVEQGFARPARRRSPCRDRPQRRRQVDPDQPAVGRPAADLRLGCMFEGRDIAGSSADQHLAHGHRPQLPEDQHLPAFHGVSKMRAWPPVAHAPCAEGFQPRRRFCRNQPTAPTPRWKPPALPIAPERVAATLSHGEQRQLEIAMCLATQPRVLLLDEPLAGMGPHESQRMVELIKSLPRTTPSCSSSTTWMPSSRVAHKLTVMVNGEVLESGTPAEVRQPGRAAGLPRRRGHSMHD
jgi:branched-chain amino acid transport system permease protein